MRGDLHKWVATITNLAALSAILCLQIFGHDLGLVRDPSVKVQVVRPADAPPGEVVPIQGTRPFEGRNVIVTVTESTSR